MGLCCHKPVPTLTGMFLNTRTRPEFQDVHAGNLLVLEDGRVAFIDFGIVGRFSPDTWGGVSRLADGVAQEDFNVMAEVRALNWVFEADSLFLGRLLYTLYFCPLLAESVCHAISARKPVPLGVQLRATRDDSTVCFACIFSRTWGSG